MASVIVTDRAATVRSVLLKSESKDVEARLIDKAVNNVGQAKIVLRSDHPIARINYKWDEHDYVQITSIENNSRVTPSGGIDLNNGFSRAGTHLIDTAFSHGINLGVKATSESIPFFLKIGFKLVQDQFNIYDEVDEFNTILLELGYDVTADSFDPSGLDFDLITTDPEVSIYYDKARYILKEWYNLDSLEEITSEFFVENWFWTREKQPKGSTTQLLKDQLARGEALHDFGEIDMELGEKGKEASRLRLALT
ncbi:MAG: hypothetical protein P0S95_02910 [Rhabdochlamydiaceae bacterium]|nr:hypothetical protein [Candidatus Amphrikana amoebophyrae]